MIIAIISDSHDNLTNIQKALKIINQKKAEVLIHNGDLCAPWILKELTTNFSGPIHLTFGNNDGEEYMLADWAFEHAKHAKFYKPVGELKLDGRKIAFTHYPIFGEGLAAIQKYDLVIFGHNHQKSEQQVGKTLLINPGSICGVGQPVSFAFYDTKTGKAEFKAF